MGDVFLLGMGIAMLFLFSVLAAGSKEDFLSSFMFLVGIVFLIGLPTLSVDAIKTGEPMTTVDVGEYKVAFVYAAGDNVALGIETKADEGSKKESEHLNLYQFPKAVFDSASRIDSQSKTLLVTEAGGIKKLVLK